MFVVVVSVSPELLGHRCCFKAVDVKTESGLLKQLCVKAHTLDSFVLNVPIGDSGDDRKAVEGFPALVSIY